MKNRKYTVRAFTLTEILVVLIIIGILVLLALPNLFPLVAKAKTTEAKIQLEHLYTLERTYFFEHSRYTTDLTDLSYEQSMLVTNGGQANYRIEVADANENAFRIRAVAVADFDGDGIFNVWEINQDKELKEVTKD